MPQRFTYPLTPLPRVAVFEQAEAFPAEPADQQTAAFPAGMLPIALLWRWRPQFPIVIFTGPLAGTLTAADRDRIWREWGVPVYEFLIDASGSVVAEECDAHNGLHLRPGTDPPAGIDASRCPCGLDTPRIPFPREDVDATLSAAA